MVDAGRYHFQSAAVPNAYDSYLVPRLFTPWARVLLDSLLPLAGVTRMAAERVGPDGAATGADISAQMLEIARAKPAPANAAPIEYVESPAAPLAVQDSAFDFLTCQQGFQFFPDRAAAAAEARRALKPGGRVGIAVWGPIQECGHFMTLHGVLREKVDRELADLILVPFSWPDPDALSREGGVQSMMSSNIATARA